MSKKLQKIAKNCKDVQKHNKLFKISKIVQKIACNTEKFAQMASPASPSFSIAGLSMAWLSPRV